MSVQQNWPKLLDKISLWLFILGVLVIIAYLAMPFLISILVNSGVIERPEIQYSNGSETNITENNYVLFEEENLTPRWVVKGQVLITLTESSTEDDLNNMTQWFSMRGARLLTYSPSTKTYLYQLREDDNLTEVLSLLENQSGVWIASPNTVIGHPKISYPESELREGHFPLSESLILFLFLSALVLKGVSCFLKMKR